MRNLAAAFCLVLTTGMCGWPIAASARPSDALPPLTLTPTSIVFHSNDVDPVPVTIAGRDCVPKPAFPASVVVSFQGSNEIRTAQPDDAGSWSVQVMVGATSGLGTIYAVCDNYLSARAYPLARLSIAGTSPLALTRHTRAFIVGGTTVGAGTRIEVRGRNWVNFDEVHIALDSVQAKLGSIATDEFGGFDAKVEIPVDTSLGAHRLLISGERVDRVIPILVVSAVEGQGAGPATAAHSGLSASGVRTAWLTEFGVLLLVFGALLLWMARPAPPVRELVARICSRDGPDGRRSSDR